jgi:hypothetical protein
MFCVHVMYPRVEGADFNEEWWRDVHTPMGLGLLFKTCGVRPKESLLTNNTIGMDRTPEGAKFHIINTMLMDTREEAEAFIDLFESTREAAILRSDRANYTGAPPYCLVGEISKIDIDGALAKADEVIDRAAAEMKATSGTA